MNLHLQDRVIIVTGGGSGIGAAISLGLIAEGAIPVIFGHQPLSAAFAAELEQQGQSHFIRVELRDEDACRAAVSDVLQRFGRIDGLVNNAGYGLFNPLESVTEAQFDGLFNVHLKGPFFLTQTVLPLLADGAAIANLTSATTRVATAGVAPYAALKGGLEVLTRYMAKEFGERRIRANAVSPGAIRTELGGGMNDEFEAMLAGQTALGRVGEPEDVGAVIATLLSAESTWINAQTIEVAGGYMV